MATLGFAKLFPVVLVVGSSVGLIAGGGVELVKSSSSVAAKAAEISLEVVTKEITPKYESWEKVVDRVERFKEKEVQVQKVGSSSVTCKQISKMDFVCEDSSFVGWKPAPKPIFPYSQNYNGEYNMTDF
ncbi:hypothetical protein [Mycoplasma suis]|uniref:Uncharacterized protein n=2 Tax=Mycoplasma suis TaxID=57372 RepID=F0QRJ7_MYCSL|nr:hypothetical protein [Mycoplasma suis]ADX98117.1 hypothetical protein MSU_0585 [Mycoplasma suis str. Illinois]CBZ40630.1 hypothetical protein MSUIS_05370 [Mycoplasma suis KI3806]